jgi:glycosyltransferase involved in cell wall biosynthesis
VRFGYLGRLHPSKGLVQLVRAVAAIPRDVAFHLEIRGPMLDAQSRAFAGELQALLAGDPRVVFEPGVPSSDVPQRLADLDVLLVPSMWFENGPTIALESMAAGTPIIASRVGNLAEIIVDGVNGRLVEAGDVDGLARALTEAAVDPAKTIDVWRGGLVPPRTMDDVTRDYLALYARPLLASTRATIDPRRRASGN